MTLLKTLFIKFFIWVCVIEKLGPHQGHYQEQ